MKFWTDRFFEMAGIGGHDVFVNPNGQFGDAQPGGGLDGASFTVRSLIVRREEIDPLNHERLVDKLKGYFETLQTPDNLQVYAQHLYDALYVFIKEARLFSLLVTYYKDLNLPVDLKQFQEQLKAQGIPLGMSPLFNEIQAQLLQAHQTGINSNNKQYSNKLWKLYNNKLHAIFGSVDQQTSQSLFSAFAAGGDNDARAAKEIISKLHQQRISEQLKNLEALIEDMRVFVQHDYSGSKATIKAIKAHFLPTLNHLLGNPDIAPIMQRVLSHPDMRIMIARGLDIHTQYISPTDQFIQGPSAAYGAKEKTIALPFSGKQFPFPLCTFKGINATKTATDYCAPTILYDEFLHAVIDIIYPNSKLDPYGNDQQEQAYTLAIQQDTQRLQKMERVVQNTKNKKKATITLLEAIKELIGTRSDTQLLEYNNRPDMVKQLLQLESNGLRPEGFRIQGKIKGPTPLGRHRLAPRIPTSS